MHTVSQRIKQFNADRVPAYTAIKYELMSENTFRFFRGTCHLFYEDLSAKNVIGESPLAWICGDLHLENFGSYKGDNRLVYFDLNDFDEALLAPAAWEVVRIVTSIFVGFDALQIAYREAMQMSRLFLAVYTATLKSGKSRYIEKLTAKGIVRLFLERVEERKLKALLKRRTFKSPRGIRFIDDNQRLFALKPADKRDLLTFMRLWLKKNHRSRFSALDVAYRVAGTGSIGIKRYVFLLKNNEGLKKYLLLDMKQAKPSSVQPFLSVGQPAWTNDASRVASIQHWMQNISPALLSAVVFRGESYVIKEMQPTADKIDFLVIKDRYKYVSRVIEDMALLTASAQLRSSGRQGSATADALMNFASNDHWQHQIIEYAASYASQVKKDFKEYAREYAGGFFQQENPRASSSAK